MNYQSNVVEELEEQNDMDKQYLTFWTDKQLFGVSISQVVQIISIQEITPIPDVPPYAKGVVNLRGSIIPVIDIRIRFGKPEIPYDEHTCIIITHLEEEDVDMGFIVDEVDEVTTIEDDHISPPPRVSMQVTNRYLIGVGRVDDKVIMLIDTTKMLSESELNQVTDAAETVDAEI